VRRCEVLVIGGGAMGSAAAWQLARRGVDVVLLERFGHNHPNGSSHGATRIFRFAYAEPTYVAMAMAALPLWRELEQDSGEQLLETTGGVDVGTEADIGPIEAALSKQGAGCERVRPDDAADRWSGLAFEDPDEVVLFQPDAGRLWAERTVAALHAQAAHHGGEVRYHEPVVSLSADTGHVQTDQDEYLAETVVLAAGAWTPQLVDGVGGLPPMTVTREQTFHFRPLEDDVVWPSFIHYRGLDAPGIYGLETPGEGVKVAEHATGAVVGDPDPDERSFEIDEIGRRRVIRYVTERIPGLDPRPVTELTCLYTSTPDNGFVLERFGPRLVVGSACSGHGFKFTPLIGQRLADLAVSDGSLRR
jgi:sarcosine oxidase